MRLQEEKGESALSNYVFTTTYLQAAARCHDISVIQRVITSLCVPAS
jgi:hypothetical protein